MSPSRPFILRPVATTLLMAAIVLAGLVAWLQLPVSALPTVDYPTIQVVTFYPGASSDVMTATVTAPLERQFGEVPGLTQMTSTSTTGASVIVLRFALDLNIDVAEQQVQESINAASTYLPPDLPTPPIYNKINPADAPILTLALTSDALPLTRVEDLADTRLAQKLAQLPGVGLVTVGGGQKPAVRVQVDPTRLAAYDLDLETLRTTIQASTLQQAKGSLSGPTQSWQIQANDQLQTSDDFRGLVVAFRDGAPVTLSQVATVIDGAEDERRAAWYDGRPAVLLNVQRQPGANTIQVVDRIERVLPQLRAALPGSVDLRVVTDRTTTIRASVVDVELELTLTIALVVGVIFVFLRSASATLIPSISVPVSLIGTLGVMYLCGFSLNNLTLMALIISTGFVVDDAIVMIENISRYVEEGMEPRQAALEGAEQIGFTIVSLTISLIAVLIPLLFMRDVVGRLFREFAITLSATILLSAVVSLTLTPMLSARLLKRRPESEQSRFERWSERTFGALVDRYGVALRWVLARKRATLLVAVGTLVLTGILFAVVPKGFFPVQDTGLVQAITETPPGTSFAALSDRQSALGAALARDPAVQGISSFVGVDGTNATPNAGRFLIDLKPLAERDRVGAVIDRLQKLAERVDGISLFLQPVQDLTVADRISRTQYQYTLEEPDSADLGVRASEFVERLRALPELTDVATDQQSEGPATFVTIDRVTASRLGISPVQIVGTLYDAFGQRQISTLYTQLNQYHVVLEALPAFRSHPSNLDDLYLLAPRPPSPPAAESSTPSPPSVLAPRPVLPSETSIPLRALARVEPATAPLAINRQGQFPVVTISFDLAPGASLDAATRAIDRVQREMAFPPNVQASFQGTAEAFRASLTNEPLLVLAALVTVYIVLGVLYESYVHPITILSTLPSAGVGALLALLLCRMELDVIALIGLILLIGIVKKNGIMMIDFALDAERNEGKSAEEAIWQAAVLRFRPILMTTMAALLAGLPLALGSGIGAELRRPLGVSMVGGLLLSQVLTLFTTPVIYVYFDALAQRLSRRKP